MKFAYVLSLALFTATFAAADSTISYLSSTGSDTTNIFGSVFPNQCSPASTPCKTLQHAVDETAANGLVVFLDSGALGAATITKSVTIDGKGVGIIGACLAHGLKVISADHVEIRNLAIHIDAGCVSDGIYAQNTYMTIRNVSITGGSVGVSLFGGSHAVIHALSVTGATWGIVSLDQVDLTVTDSDIQYATTAIDVEGQTFPTAALIERTRLASNITGLTASNFGAAPTVRISDCVIFGNATGVTATGGAQIITLRNNVWLGNITDGTTPFAASLK